MFISVESKFSKSQQYGVVLGDWRIPRGKISLPGSLRKQMNHLVVSARQCV